MVNAAKVVVTSFLIFASTSFVKADVIDMEAIKEWQHKLDQASTPDDSIMALYNLFDITLRSDSGVYSSPLMSLSQRTRDYHIVLDIIRKVVNKNTSDTLLVDTLIKIARTVPPDDDQRETLLFIELRKLQESLNNMNEEQRLNKLYQLVNEYRDNDKVSIYDRILPLYRLTMALGKTVGGDLYSDYMDRLYLLIRALPDTTGPLSSLFYTQASIVYTITGEHAKAVKANKRLLEIVDTLKERNKENGHPYANYNNNEFVALRRMLVNYPALTPEEIDSYYNRICYLIENDIEIAEEFSSVARVRSYYLMAKKRYREAIPTLKKAIAHEKNAEYRLRMYKMLVDCCEATGNVAERADARNAYIKSLEEVLDQRQRDKISELQLLLDVNANFRDSLARKDAETTARISQSRTVSTVSTVVAVIAVIALIALLVYYRRKA